MSGGVGLRNDGPLGSYSRGLRVQLRVIGALLMRELHTRYGRDNIGYLWVFLEPLTLATAIALMHSGAKEQHGSDIRPLPFVVLGYCLFIMFRGLVSRSEGALESNAPLLYHRTVSIFDMMFSRGLLEGVGSMVSFGVLLIFGLLFGLADPPVRPLELLLAFIFMFVFAFALSLLVVAGTHDNRLVARFVHPVVYVLMPLSGAFFILDWLPEPYRTWMSWSPLVQIFELARYGMFESAKRNYIDLAYLTGWCLFLNYLGLVSVKVMRRRIHLS